jgi:hypothetical protein
MKKRIFTTDTNEIQKIIQEYFENPYSNKLESEEEIYEFLNIYDSPKSNQEDISNLNRLIASKETETLIKKLPRKKSPDSDGFIAEFYQTFKKIPMLLKLFHRIQKEEILTNSFHEASMTLIPKPSKDTSEKKDTGQYC